MSISPLESPQEDHFSDLNPTDAELARAMRVPDDGAAQARSPRNASSLRSRTRNETFSQRSNSTKSAQTMKQSSSSPFGTKSQVPRSLNGHDLEDEEAEPINYDEYGVDGDIVERIRSRASVTSDKQTLMNLQDKYRDGLFELEADDMRRPQNWSMKKRLIYTVMYGVTTLSAQMCSSVVTPGVLQLSEELKVGSEVGILAFSIFIVGNMFGPALFAPVSELYGRKVGILIPCFVAGVFQCVCANVDNIASLVVFRFISGVFAAAPIAAAGGAMADMWPARQRGAALVLYGANIIIGASGSPVLGALLAGTGNYGWRWCLWLGGLFSMLISSLNFIIMEETFLPVIEQKAARTKRLDTGFWGLHSDHDKWQLTMREFITVHLRRPILMLATPIVTSMVLYAGFTFGLLYILITSIGKEFQTQYGFSVAASYCPLFAFTIGYIIGGGVNILQSMRYAKRTQKAGKRLPPEERLPGMMLFGWFLPAGMFIYGWCLRSNIHWMVPTLGLGFVGLGLSVIFQGCLVYLTDVYTKYAASVIAANTIVRSICGGVFPLFSRQMYNKLGVHWASSLLGFVGFALVPMPWFLYFFGAKIRAHDPFKQKLAM